MSTPLPAPYDACAVEAARLADEASGLAPWQRILSAVLRARLTAPGARERTGPPSAPLAGGCLRRLLVLIGLFMLVIAVTLFLFGRALVHALQTF